MSVRFRCKNCGQKYELNESWVGKITACMKCGFDMQVPLVSDLIAGREGNSLQLAGVKSVFNFDKIHTIYIHTTTVREQPDDIIFRCKICGQKYRLEKKLAGQLAECARCKRNMVVPRRSETTAHHFNDIRTLDDNLIFWCHACGQKYRLEKKLGGHEVKCTGCHSHFNIPEESEIFPPANLSMSLQGIAVDPQKTNDSISTDTLFSIDDRSRATIEATKTVTDMVKYIITMQQRNIFLFKISRFQNVVNGLMIFLKSHIKTITVILLVVLLLIVFLYLNFFA